MPWSGTSRSLVRPPRTSPRRFARNDNCEADRSVHHETLLFSSGLECDLRGGGFVPLAADERLGKRQTIVLVLITWWSDEIPKYVVADVEWTAKETWIQGGTSHGLVRSWQGRSVGTVVQGNRRRIGSEGTLAGIEGQAGRWSLDDRPGQAHCFAWRQQHDLYATAGSISQSGGISLRDPPEGTLQRPGQVARLARYRGGRPRIRRGVHHQEQRRGNRP